jgi:hypothetical protein
MAQPAKAHPGLASQRAASQGAGRYDRYDRASQGLLLFFFFFFIYFF